MASIPGELLHNPANNPGKGQLNRSAPPARDAAAAGAGASQPTASSSSSAAVASPTPAEQQQKRSGSNSSNAVGRAPVPMSSWAAPGPPPITPPNRSKSSAANPGNAAGRSPGEEESSLALTGALGTTADTGVSIEEIFPDDKERDRKGLSLVSFGSAFGPADTLRGSASGPEAPPSTPFLPRCMEPAQAYMEFEARAETSFQKEVLETLREWDDAVEARFKARQILNLVKRLEAQVGPVQKPARRWADKLTWGCCVWVATAFLSLFILMLLSASFTTDIRLEEEAVLLTSFDDLPVGSGALVSRHSFIDMCKMPEADLRRVTDCTFVYRGAQMNIRVASLVRDTTGYLRIHSPDSATLHVEAGGREALLDLPFAGKERVYFGAAPFPSNTPAKAPEATGCSLAVMADREGRPAR